jgi:hypothetical protein
LGGSGKRLDEGGRAESAALLTAALEYAARQWPVFPCEARGKRPLTPNGFRDATIDEQTIRAWWKRWPKANIGIPTGPATFDVLDVDGQVGEATLAGLEAKHGELPGGPVQHTGGGGRHKFFRGGTLGTTAKRLGAGLDTRGEGGYIIAAPSVHSSGAVYVLEDDEEPIFDPPAWLRVELGSKKVANGKADPWRPGEIGQGERNDRIFRIASSLRAQEFDEESIMVLARMENAKRCVPPLPDEEVRTIVGSVMKYQPGVAKEQLARAVEKAASEVVKQTKLAVKAEEERALTLAGETVSDGELDEVRALILRETGVPVQGVIQAGRDHARYYLELAGANPVYIGTSIASQKSVGDAMLRHRQDAGFSLLKAKKWPVVLRGLLRLVVVRDDVEHERQGETAGWVLGVVETDRKHNRLQKSYDAISRKLPFIEEGWVYINSSYLLRRLRMANVANALTQAELVSRLRELGFSRGPNEKGVVSVRAEEGQTSAAYWRIEVVSLGAFSSDDAQ